MADRFPNGCFRKECPHFKSWDIGIDDVYYYCDLLKVECGIYDNEFGTYECPLSDVSKEGEGESK
jgi:hypothetical protein